MINSMNEADKENNPEITELPENTSLVVFMLDEKNYSVFLRNTIRVIPSLEIQPLPETPSVIAGIINLNGEPVAVINIWKRFKLPEREITVNEYFIIANTGKRLIALPVDEVKGLKKIPTGAILPLSSVVTHSAGFVRGVIMLDDGMLLICDLEKFLSEEEDNQLEKAFRNDPVNVSTTGQQNLG